MDKLISFPVKKNLKINSEELVVPLGELQELLSEAEDPYFELKIGGFRSVERLFGHGGVLAQLQIDFSEVGYG